MLDRTHRLPDGTTLVVEGDVHDIARRLHEGDPTLGWAGDPNLILFLNVASGMFEVWAPDEHAEPYLAISHPRCDPSLIAHLVQADNRRATPYDRVVEANMAADKAAADARADHHEQVADRLHHALRKDLGHLY